MAKPERPSIVVQVELAIQMGAPCTQHVKTMMAYIQQLETHAELQGKALSYLQGVIRSGSVPTASDRISIIEMSRVLAHGHDDRMPRRDQ